MKGIKTELTKELIDNCYNLLMIQLTPQEIRAKLEIDHNMWISVSSDAYFQTLLLGNGSKEGNNESIIKKRIKDCKEIELSLFTKLAIFKLYSESSEERAKLRAEIDKLQSKYAGFNCYEC